MDREGRLFAAYLRHRAGVRGAPTQAGIDALIAGEGVKVEEIDVGGEPGQIKGCCVANRVFLPAGLDPGLRRWVLVHELVHYLCGDSYRLYSDYRVSEWVEADARAELVTGYFFLGDLPERAGDEELATMAGVPADRIRCWRRLASASHPLPDRWSLFCLAVAAFLLVMELARALSPLWG